MKTLVNKSVYISNNIIRFGILLYWSVYWLINSLDKMIGGSQFLWVGKDRFAQFQKFFASAGWESPIISNVALVIVASLEIFAFIFFLGALIYLLKRNKDDSRSWFVVGISLTLTTFTIFAIGDHIFGDRFELLEHTLFWFITLFSWVAFVHADKFTKISSSIFPKKQLIASTIVLIVLILISSLSIFGHKNEAYHERRDAVLPTMEENNLYKFSFPFLAGSTSFEKSLEDFKEKNPQKKIIEVYTVPEKLRKQKAEGLIVFVLTEDKI